jgi:transcriptional regulator with XRE-family HTH domain
MTSGRKPNQERRRQAPRLRAEGLTLEEIGNRLGVCRQGAAYLLAPLREPPAVDCRRCGAALNSPGATSRDAGKALSLPCVGKCPEASFGERLKAFRLAAGLSQSELARKAGVWPSIIHKYELKGHRLRPGALARLARALGVPAEALKRGSPVPQRLRTGAL